MKVLLLNQFYWPDLTATSQLLTDLTRHLAEEGHQVTVICGGAAYAGADSTGQPRGVRILRTWALPFARGPLARVGSYLSYFLGALWFGLWAGRQDVIVSMTTPPLLSLIGWMIEIRTGGRHYIWEMDMYPDVMVDLGMFPANHWIVRFLGALADFGRRKAYAVISLGECMTRRLLDRGVPIEKIAIAENWADGNRIFPPAHPPSNSGLSFIYTGNMGMGHEFETLKGAMLALKQRAEISYTFVGGGARKPALEQFCRDQNISSAQFLSYRSPDELKLLTDNCHIGLVTQIPAVTGSIVPSKVYAQMAAGLPILFIGAPEAQPARIIERYRCGWHVACGDVAGLTRLIEWLAANPEEVRLAGDRAYRAFLAHHDRPLAVRHLGELLGAGRPRGAKLTPNPELQHVPNIPTV